MTKLAYINRDKHQIIGVRFRGDRYDIEIMDTKLNWYVRSECNNPIEHFNKHIQDYISNGFVRTKFSNFESVLDSIDCE